MENDAVFTGINSRSMDLNQCGGEYADDIYISIFGVWNIYLVLYITIQNWFRQ